MKKRVNNNFFRKGIAAILFIFLAFIFIFLFLLSLRQPQPPANIKQNLTLNFSNKLKPSIQDKFMQLQKILSLKNEKDSSSNVGKLFFSGDMMLDRGVEDLMKKKKDFNYPFSQIKDLWQGADQVVVNLEGPIVKNPPVMPEHSLQFAFSPELLQPIKDNGITLLSLANNHSLNMGQDGLKQTRDFLSNNKLGYFGDPIKCTEEFAYKQGDFVFLSFNKTYAYCSEDDILKTIANIKKTNTDKFIIVTIHWGIEYKIVHSQAQADLAHKIIDNGADLIIGHHPHVVEDVELYKNKVIFYSLGNFIFDQYFSEKTQQGLIIGLTKFKNKVIYNIYPLSLTFSQPYLMSVEDSAEFLAELAEKGQSDIKAQIKKGVLEVNF